MRPARVSRRAGLLGGAGLLAAALVAATLIGGRDAPPAPPAVLDRIAEKNDDAATEAAARMKADSEAATRAADARLAAKEGAAAR